MILFLGPGLYFGSYFDNSGIMEMTEALRALAGLSQPSRLAVFRLLVQVGPDGLAAGDIAKQLSVPTTTLSFHLSQLHNANLVTSQRLGRSIRYAANFHTMNGLIGFLTDNCCGGDISACAPELSTQPRSTST